MAHIHGARRLTLIGVCLSGMIFCSSPASSATARQLQNSAQGQCLAVTAGGNLVTRDCAANDSNQLWIYDSRHKWLKGGDGSCIATGGKYRQVFLARCRNDKKLKWKYDAKKGTFRNDKYRQCLDVEGGASNAPVQIWRCNKSAAQHWEWVDAPPPPPPPQDFSNLHNLLTGQCLNVDPGAAPVVNDCASDDPAQLWRYDSQTGTISDASNRCLTAPKRFDFISVTSCSNSTAQKWQYDPANKTYTSQSTGQCLDVWGGEPYAEIGVWTCEQDPRQQWTFDQGVAPQGWAQHHIRFDGVAPGVDDAGKRLLASLGSGFETPHDYQATISYASTNDGDSFRIDGVDTPNGASHAFANIHYGSKSTIERFRNGKKVDEYTILFTNLPVVELNAEAIADEPKLPGDFHLAASAYRQDTGTLPMGIEIRGQTAQAFPKKAYDIEIHKPDDPTSELKIRLLDLRKDGDWILDAAYRDQVFVRNLVCHDIYRELRPFAWVDSSGNPNGQSALRGHLAEVILNHGYNGLYVLEEQVDRKLLGLKKITVPTDENGNERWDLVDFSNPDNGSVLYKANFEQASLYDPNTVIQGFEQKYPKAADIVHWEPLQQLTSFIANSSDAEFVAGIGDRVDIDSVVDFWLLSLVSQAQDNISKNYFLARSGAGRFFMVTWDFDATFGMFWDGSPDLDTAWWFPTDENNLIRRLSQLTATGFNAKVKQRWNALRSTLFTEDALVARFATYLDRADAAGARDRNNQRWPASGGAGANHPELGKLSFLRNWIHDRLTFVDARINALNE